MIASFIYKYTCGGAILFDSRRRGERINKQNYCLYLRYRFICAVWMRLPLFMQFLAVILLYTKQLAREYNSRFCFITIIDDGGGDGCRAVFLRCAVCPHLRRCSFRNCQWRCAPLDFIHIIYASAYAPYQKIYLFYLAHAQRIFSSLLFVGLPHHSH